MPPRRILYSAGQKFCTFDAMDFLWPPEGGLTLNIEEYEKINSFLEKARKKFPFKCAKLLTKIVGIITDVKLAYESGHVRNSTPGTILAPPLKV